MINCISDVAKQHPKCWSYLVLAVATISQGLTVGTAYGVAGVLTIASAHRFNISTAESSWVTSVQIAFILGFSPVIAVIMKAVPIQVVQIVGGGLTILGYCLASAATANWVVVVCVGVVAGIGTSAVYNAGAGILSQVFSDDQVYFALSICSWGFTGSLLVFPILGHFLLESFGFSTMMIVIGLLGWVATLGGFFYHAPEVKKVEEEEKVGILESLVKVIHNPRAIVYALSGFFRKCGLTAFFSLFAAYYTETSRLSNLEAATANTVFGVTTTVGAVAISLTHGVDYDKLAVQALTVAVYGVLLIVVTEINGTIYIMLLMGLIGLAYGIQYGNLMGVARSIGGKEEMSLVFAVDLLLEGIGSIIGPQIASVLEKTFGTRIGIKFSGVSCLLASCCIAPVLLWERLRKPKKGSCPRSELAKSYQLPASQPLLDDQNVSD